MKRKADWNLVPSSHNTSSLISSWMGKITHLTPSKLDSQNNVNWPLWLSTTGWWLKKNRVWANINGELERFNIVIAAVRETRLPSTCSLREQEYPLLSSVEPPSKKARFLSLRLSTSSGPVSILSIYAPTLSSAADNKDEFYEELKTTIRVIPPTGHLHLRSDFTARIRLTKNPGPAPLTTLVSVGLLILVRVYQNYVPTMI